MTPEPVCIPRELQLQAAMFRLGNVEEQIRGGYDILRQHHKTVTIFGSARTPKTSEYYQKARGKSIGFNIDLPHEQSLNPYTTNSFAFSHFAPRKIVMTMMADAYVYFPGGFGTIDELSEILTLTQTSKINRAPIILFDTKFWGKWHNFVAGTMRNQEKVISPGDEELYIMTEDLDQIMSIITGNKTYCGH